MTIKVIGFQCARTQQTLLNVEEAVEDLDEQPVIETIDSFEQIMESGAPHTPSLMIGDRVLAEGRIPSVYEISTWIREPYYEEAETF